MARPHSGVENFRQASKAAAASGRLHPKRFSIVLMQLLFTKSSQSGFGQLIGCNCIVMFALLMVVLCSVMCAVIMIANVRAVIIGDLHILVHNR